MSGGPVVVAGGASVFGQGAGPASRRPNPAKFGTATFNTPSRTARIAARLGSAAEPNASAWATLTAAYDLARVPDGPQSDPLEVPGTYTDPAGNTAQVVPLRYDGIAAYNFALRYRLYGDEAAAAAAARQIVPWSTLSGWSNPVGTNTRLSWAEHFPAYLAAADMIEGSAAYTNTLRTNLRDCATRSLVIPGSIAYGNTNNQGDWGVLLRMAIGAFTRDRAVFDGAVARWKSILDTCLNGDGDLTDEIYRQDGGQGDGSSGLHYCAFALCAKTYAAELARANGVWLYDYETPGGFSLNTLWSRIAPWAATPASYPYNSSGTPSSAPDNIGAFEVLQSLWPSADGLAALAAQRPSFDRYGAPYMTLSHPGQPLRG